MNHQWKWHALPQVAKAMDLHPDDLVMAPLDALPRTCRLVNKDFFCPVVMGLIIGFLLIFNGFCWKCGFWWIPSSVICVVHPCRGLFLPEKHPF